MSVTDKGAAIVNEDVRTRLQAVALELFQQHGYDATSASAIAARAGVTERTFFRYFPDKREVLFGAEDMVRAAITTGIGAAPDDLSPLDMFFHAYEAFCPVVEGRRAYAKPRQDLIVATPALRERELTKVVALGAAAAEALRQRDVPSLEADLAGQIGMLAVVQATASWLGDDGVGLWDRIVSARDAIRALSMPHPTDAAR